MIVENVEQSVLKKYLSKDKINIMGSFVPYKENTAVKVYDYEKGEPLGDVPEEFVSKYINEKPTLFSIREKFDDSTGLFHYELETFLTEEQQEELKKKEEEKKKEEKKSITQKWWFWVLVFMLLGMILNAINN